MNDEIERKLLRQLKLLNFWISTFGVLLLVTLGIIGFLMFQAVMFMKSTGDKITNFQETTTEKLDVKSQVCNGTDSFSAFIKSNTDACR
jgi:hypothetical protein